jgi:hypothetical protein
MVSTEVGAEPLVTLTLVGLNAHMGAAVTTGLIDRQERVTVPV